MAEARISISISDGTLEFEGSEEFVSTQIKEFSEIIKGRLSAEPPQRSKNGGGEKKETPETPLPEALQHLFAETEDGVQILKDIPGESNAKKTVNAAKLLLYGLNALKKKDTVLFEEVAKVCESHGFHDAPNMASNLKACKSTFVFGGSGRKQTLKLTVPGMKEAQTLVDSLISGDGK